jgi:hypothetical protein
MAPLEASGSLTISIRQTDPHLSDIIVAQQTDERLRQDRYL